MVIERLATFTQYVTPLPTEQHEKPGHRLEPVEGEPTKAPRSRRRRIVPRGFTSIYAPVAVAVVILAIVAGVRSLFWPPNPEPEKKRKPAR